MSLRHRVEHGRHPLIAMRIAANHREELARRRRPRRCRRPARPEDAPRVARSRPRARRPPVDRSCSSRRPRTLDASSRRPLSTESSATAGPSESIVTTTSAPARPPGSGASIGAVRRKRRASIDRPIPYREREAGIQEVSGHREAHPPDPGEPDLEIRQEPARRPPCTSARSCSPTRERRGRRGTARARPARPDVR